MDVAQASKTLQDLALTLLEKVQQGIVQYGPEALKLVLFTMRLEAMLSLAISGFAVLIAIWIVRWGLRRVEWMQQNDPGVDKAKSVAEVVGIVAGGIYSIVAGLWFIFTWLDVGVWFAVVDPRLALVRQIVHRVLDNAK